MENREKKNIDLILTDWGRWKRELVIGLEYPSSTIEAKIIEGKGKIYDSGCYGGGRDESTKNKIRFQGRESQLRLDTIIRKLREKHSREMKIIVLVYMMQWSNRKIAKQSKLSRHTIRNYLMKGMNLINVSLDL